MQIVKKNTYYSDSFNYKNEGITIIILGASGDLAKKKTYPSLFQLYSLDYLPKEFNIIGFARSKFTNIKFRENIKKYLVGNNQNINKFLNKCYYNKADSYDDIESWKKCNIFSKQLEKEFSSEKINRLFYFAIPATRFRESAYVIKNNCISDKGWNRFILEKPFGKNYNSYLKLANELNQIVAENDLYRIDHYLGKEMVQNLMVLRFSNIILSSVWNSRFIKHVIIQFKEDFGTEGRGGYFNDFGIIRDVIQNHLIQVLSLIAMEPPVCVEGIDHSTYIRDEKVKVLRCVSELSLQDIILGQYTSFNEKPGYLDDDTVPSESKRATYCMAKFKINNARWEGVPFIIEAGKALDTRCAEVRIKFKKPPGYTTMFGNYDIPNNELVLSIQPDHLVKFNMNIKIPGFKTYPMMSSLNLNYANQFPELSKTIPEAYTRLILDVLRGQNTTFVRDDELKTSWAIFTPLLNILDSTDCPKPYLYKYGCQRPIEATNFLKKII